MAEGNEKADKKRLVNEGRKFLGSLFGTLLYAIGINMFVVPANLYTSGLLGICQVIQTLLLKTLGTVTSMTIFLAVIPIIPIVKDTMTACVVGGIVTGAGVGLTLRMGASLGGIDVIGVLITRRKKDFSVGKINFLVNLILYGTCLFLFNVELVVYSLIYAAVYSAAMDKVHMVHLKNIVHKHDPNAFIVINEGVAVDGNYLKKL